MTSKWFRVPITQALTCFLPVVFLLLLLACGDGARPRENSQPPAGEPGPREFLFLGGEKFVRTVRLATDGTMEPVAEIEVPGLVTSRAMTATPDGRFLYVGTDVYGNRASEGEIALLGFNIDPATGALTQIPGSPFPYEQNPQNLTVTPDGRFLITMGNGIFHQYEIDSTTGAISAIDSLSINESACCTFQRVFDPARSYFYELTGVGDSIHILNMTATFGIEDAGFAANPLPDAYISDIAIDPRGTYLYAAENGAGAVQTFRIRDGGLEPLGAPLKLGGVTGLIGPLAMDSDGAHLFVAYDGNPGVGAVDRVSVLQVDADSGALSIQNPSAASIPHAQTALVDPTGRFLLFNDATASGVVGFRIEPGGELTALPGNSDVSPDRVNAVVAVVTMQQR